MSEMPNCFLPPGKTIMSCATAPGASWAIKEINQFLRIPGDKLTECIETASGLTKVSKNGLETALKVQWNVAGCTIGETKCIQ